MATWLPGSRVNKNHIETPPNSCVCLHLLIFFLFFPLFFFSFSPSIFLFSHLSAHRRLDPIYTYFFLYTHTRAHILVYSNFTSGAALRSETCVYLCSTFCSSDHDGVFTRKLFNLLALSGFPRQIPINLRPPIGKQSKNSSTTTMIILLPRVCLCLYKYYIIIMLAVRVLFSCARPLQIQMTTLQCV